MRKKTCIIILALSLTLGFSGCGPSSTSNPKVADGPTHDHAHGHAHHAPHGGTAVVLGAEAYHIEFVLDAAAGQLSAYVLDGEMENFIRIQAPAIEVVAQVAAGEQTLLFKPVANSATGETEGDTSLYRASAEWLRVTPKFDGVIKSITVRGQEFKSVPFNFPRGNEHHH